MHCDAQSFKLETLDELTGSQLGSSKLIYIMCLYLANLQLPGIDNTSKKGKRRNSVQGAGKDLTVPQTEGGGDTTPRGNESSDPSFMQALESELSDVIKMRDNADRMKRSALMSHTAKFERLKVYLEGWLDGNPESDRSEMCLFAPSDGHQSTQKQWSIGRFAESAAWVKGRKNLAKFLQRIDDAVVRTKAQTALFIESEEKLKEFAALQDKDQVDYVKIVDEVVKFMRRLSDSWAVLSANSEPLKFLHTVRPLAMLLAERGSLISDYWKDISVSSEKKAKPWTAEQRSQVMRRMFRLFDLDGTGAVDAEELRVTLGALGIQLPKDGLAHFQLVTMLDKTTGKIDQEHFEKFVKGRLVASFRLFLGTQLKGKNLITFQELQRRTRFDDATVEDMLNVVSVGPETAKSINYDTFEQIMLLPENRTLLLGEPQTRRKSTT